MKKRIHLLALAITPLLAFSVSKSASAQTKAATAPKSTCNAKDKVMKVKLTTSMGAIVVELNKEKAPISTDNFVKYVESGHYNGTIFHRVIDGFMIQGGGMLPNMTEKPTSAPIKNESTNGLKNDKYTLAMARTQVRDSATSQFFVNVKDNDFLNYSGETPNGYGYAVFGKVVEGTDVIDKMKLVQTGNKGMHQNVPQQTITIDKAECM
jgi:peptidyl-prolyl cis-trans isomerase B (cyclophilin B)